MTDSTELDIDGIVAEAMLMVKMRVRGQHSNSKVIRLCAEIRALHSRLADAERLAKECIKLFEQAKDSSSQLVEDTARALLAKLAAAKGGEGGEGK